MSNTIVNLFLVLLIASLVLSGCGVAQSAPIPGEVYGLQPGTIVKGLQLVVSGTTEVRILQNVAEPNNFLFAWPLNDGWGFISFNARKWEEIKDIRNIIQASGNFVCCQTIKDLVDTLTKTGWKQITSSELPPLVVETIIAAKLWFTQLASMWATYFIMPAGGLEILYEDLNISPQGKPES
jgi:hypothetical protein